MKWMRYGMDGAWTGWGGAWLTSARAEQIEGMTWDRMRYRADEIGNGWAREQMSEGMDEGGNGWAREWIS